MPVWASLFLLSLAATSSPQDFPDPSGYVVDQAGVIDAATEARLLGYIQELKQKTGAELAVVTVNSLGGLSVERYTMGLAERWEVGKRGEDTGVIILGAIQDRKWRIAVGYGNEGILPDARAGSIGRRHLVPHFKAGNYSMGLYEAALAVMHLLAEERGVSLGGVPATRRRARSGGGRAGTIGSVFGTCFIILVIVMMMGRSGRGRHGWRGGAGPWLFLFLMMGSGHRRGGWGHGGFGGGSFGGGGFGGFGGGSFGGGGASGSW